MPYISDDRDRRIVRIQELRRQLGLAERELREKKGYLEAAQYAHDQALNALLRETEQLAEE